MPMNPRIKNPLILTIVSTVFLIPVLILVHYLFLNTAIAWWLIMIVTVAIYFVIIFLVFLYYGNIGRK